MVSFDICSLFTNIPLTETINIILTKLFPDQTSLFHGFTKDSFRKLLELSVTETYFTFNNKIYKQIDGMAMGSPLGPTFANIFMCHLENLFMNQCPLSFKPLFYRRYVDDTFVLFRDMSHADEFLNYINSFHSNIQFTIELEENNKISFLDILISRNEDNFLTGIFRKKTFTGLGQNFFSNCPISFKVNACKTLLFRAFSLSSNWKMFHNEINFLKSYFNNNSYPAHIFENVIRKFLDQIFRPKINTYNVPKKQMYVSLPFTVNYNDIKHKLTNVLLEIYPYVDFKFVLKNPLTIGSMFNFKDTLPELMRSSIIYKFTCPKCNLGTYVGYSSRLMRVRIDSHRGVSHRTGSNLNKKQFSAIRSHSYKCNHSIN